VFFLFSYKKKGILRLQEKQEAMSILAVFLQARIDDSNNGKTSRGLKNISRNKH
jgi:hypothetical protein